MTRQRKGIAGRFVRATDANDHIRPLADIEAEVIRIAMRRYKNQSEAARRLRIGRATLIRRLEKLGMR